MRFFCSVIYVYPTEILQCIANDKTNNKREQLLKIKQRKESIILNILWDGK